MMLLSDYVTMIPQIEAKFNAPYFRKTLDVCEELWYNTTRPQYHHTTVYSSSELPNTASWRTLAILVNGRG